MCGIVAVQSRPSERTPPRGADIVSLVEQAQSLLAGEVDVHALEQAAGRLEEADAALRGTPGVRCLVGDPTSAATLDRQCVDIEDSLSGIETALDRGEMQTADLEDVNRALVRVRDAIWAVRRDRLRTAEAVRELAGPEAGPAAIEAFRAVQLALSSIDRLEVRGRDSAGVHVLVRGHGLDLDSPSVRSLLEERADPLFRSGAVRIPGGHLGFVYKAAAEIGELGDNTRAIREAVREDALLHLALGDPGARATVVAHTRWASVGMISEPNAHPLNSEEADGRHGPYCIGVLNGDVDNHADLKAEAGLDVRGEITTDAKVIPTLWSRRAAEGAGLEDAFRDTVSAFEGSVAIAAQSADAPERLMLALRGSGQALYVGLAEDTFLVASEPYGLVEEAGRYLRMDGEAPSPSGTRGQVVVLDEQGAGTVEGIRRLSYDGTEMPVSSEELVVPEITTRDIDRGDHPHFLLKEITESPTSFRKTLRGKIVERDGGLAVELAEQTLPAGVRERLRAGAVKRVYVIGQGTAAVAGRSLAITLQGMLSGTSVAVEALAATELSGFKLRDDMSESLVVAISQSGTTTDTNRTVELVRSRGAVVVAIVNRRQSDLVDRSHGVLYTSDGRDVEMAVPSTKAFYAQVAAGFLLAVAIADELGVPDGGRDRLLEGLRRLPDAMERVLGQRQEIAEIAQRHAPYRRYWAVVGNGANRIAAEEVRIKLSELCYKSIACDVTEDKKHIDLSAEPLILVCAAGLQGSNAEDVAKEIAIYRAHKAAPIVIGTEGDARYPSALDVVWVRGVHPALDFVLSAMAGHLFGYEAALAIDAQAHPLRQARAAIESVTSAGMGPDLVALRLAATLEPIAQRFFEGLREGAYNGHLEASTAVRLASLFRYATGIAPLELYQVEHGRVGTPAVVVEDLTDALTKAIDELTRPIDAIKHQAKTVTVGISRSEETYLQVPLVREVLTAGVARDGLSYRSLRALAALDPAVEEVLGYTHYRVEGDVDAGEATAHITDRGGIAREIPSRTEREPQLRGTKRRVAEERELLVSRGRRDGRTVLVVPEVKGTEVTGLALLHVRFRDRLPAPEMRKALEGYRGRFAALRDLVMETEPTFREDVLADLPVADLLIDSVQALADRWRANGG